MDKLSYFYCKKCKKIQSAFSDSNEEFCIFCDGSLILLAVKNDGFYIKENFLDAKSSSNKLVKLPEKDKKPDLIVSNGIVYERVIG